MRVIVLPLYYFYVITSPYRRVFVFEWSTVRTRRPRKSCVIQITSMPGRRLICVFLCQTLIHSNDISLVIMQCNRTSTSANRVFVVSSNIDMLILSILLICCMFFPFYHKVPTIHLARYNCIRYFMPSKLFTRDPNTVCSAWPSCLT